MTSRPSRVLLHVGLPKTGTSFVQQVMGANAERLARAGVHVADPEGRQTFLAVLDLRQAHAAWGRSERQVRGTWDRLARRATKTGAGTTVISSELLAGATPEEVRRAVTSFGRARVEVVVTVRDPWRQLPAEWQEGVKHGRTNSWPGFLTSVFGRPKSRFSRHFWQVQDPVEVLARWGLDVPPDRIHVITVPPAGAPQDLLWRRYAEVLGVPDLEVDFPEPGVNAALGVVQIEVLRRVNKRYRRKGRAAAYGAVAKRLYGRQILGRFERTRVRIPDRRAAEIEALADRWRAGLSDVGYRVTGDLGEIATPPAPDPTLVDPRTIRRGELLQMSLDATGLLLEEVERLRAENLRLSKGRPEDS